MTGIDGSLTTRYVRDEFSTRDHGAGPASSGRSRQLQSDLREELFVMTHGYVYHPNFLTLDVGGGPIVHYGVSVADSTETQAVKPLYNLTARATFLREKPYRASLFYEHLNPILNVSPGQVLAQETTRYGGNLLLLAPFTPVPLELDVSRSETEGRSADRVIDDRIDQLDLHASRALGAHGTTELQFQAMQQESRSGSPNLPIQATRSQSESLDVDSRLHFGARRQYEIVNLVDLSHQSYSLDQGSLPDRTDMRVLLDARAKLRDRLQTFGTYSYSGSDQGEITSQLHSAALGVNYWVTEKLETTVGVHGEQNRTGELTALSRGGDGSIRYERPLPFGVVQGSYAARYDVREQHAATPDTRVIGERITLTGTTWVALAHPRVVAGSVVVSSAARTQTFVEGRDYTLTLVGLETRLQRLVSGTIVDGQEVVVDYAYDTGRTFGSTQLDQTLNVGWNLSRYLSLYYRRFESWPTLTSGTPSSPLNTVHSDLYGIRTDIPVKLGLALSFGGGYEQEIRRETIAPYRREAFDLYAQNDDPLFDTTIRIGTHRTWLTYEKSVQDVDLVGYDVRLSWRHPIGLDVTANGTYEEDTGGPVPRSFVTGSLKVQWTLRKVTLGLDFGLTRESQGPVDRDRMLIQFLLRRAF